MFMIWILSCTKKITAIFVDLSIQCIYMYQSELSVSCVLGLSIPDRLEMHLSTEHSCLGTRYFLMTRGLLHEYLSWETQSITCALYAAHREHVIKSAKSTCYVFTFGVRLFYVSIKMCRDTPYQTTLGLWNQWQYCISLIEFRLCR